MAKKKAKSNSQHAATQQSEASKPTVVGIGASAGGLTALKHLFESVPADSGLVFVVVVHLSPDYKSHLADLLQPSVRFPVRQVTQTISLEPNNVYVIPPNANLSAIDTHLRLSKLEENRRERAPIDHFLRTLAKTHDGHSIGVILTGTGSDGTLGLREVKAKGGVILVQDPNEAEFDGMPQSAIATGLVDRILPLAEIPETLMRLATVEPKLKQAVEDEDPTASERVLLPKVVAILKTRTDRDFSRYKPATLLRRIARRMQLNYLDDFERYLEKLREQPDEARALGDDLLINVTSFFRDPEVFQKLQTEVIPHLFEGKGPADTVRVWSVGCATGEEAYSLAMVLIEEATRHEAPPLVQIFASDLHKRSLESAREGLYPGDIQTDVSPERLERFFQKENGGYRICKEVRDMVVFAPHNLLSDPPFSRLDLIACRNLLIYLERGVQRDVVDLFHYALCPNGYLLLGSAETIDASELFRTEDKKLCVYRKRNVPAPEPRLPVFPLTRFRIGTEPSSKAEYIPSSVPFQTVHQDLLERFAPPSILVGPDNKLVHSSEHAGRYLVIPGGETTFSALRLVRDELRIELSALLQAARDGKNTLDSRPISVRFNGHSAPVVMHVRPAQKADQEGFVLVIFEEHQAQAPFGDGKHEEVGGGDPGRFAERTRELEAELHTARQRLQTVIEEYETSREEMKASHEEMQSTNEELRSTMEELETSKEELQSINEELQTVNQENRHKVEELSQLSSDLQNLLTSTEIATLFLDRDFRILRFTPRLADLFNVRVTDRGRPISDLTHRLGYQQLRDDAHVVLERLVPIEREIQDEAGRWYLTRVLPYRSTEDRIEGVVITFVEITGRKHAEDALRRSEERLQLALNASQMGTFLYHVAEDRGEPDQRMLALYGLPETATLNLQQALSKIIHPDDKASYAEAVARATDPAGSGSLRSEIRLIHPDGSVHWVEVVAQVMFDGEPRRATEMWGISYEITERKRTEQVLRGSEEHKAVLLKLSDALHSLDDPIAIQQAAMKILADHLLLSRAFYFQVERDKDGWEHVIDSEYVRAPGLPSMIGRHKLKNFGSQHFEQLAQGIPLQVQDVATLPGATPAELACYQAVGVVAFVNVPLRRNGEYSAGITAHDVAPRVWKPAEIELMRDVGDRIWGAVERARAEAALREREKRFSALIEASSYSIYTMSPDWKEMRFLEGKGFLTDQLTPEPEWQQAYILSEDRPHIVAAIDEAIRTRSMFQLEHRVLRADGSIGWTLSRAVPLLDDKGAITEWFGAASDVTVRKDAEQRFRESEENQRRLVEGMPQLVWRSKDEGFWTWSSPQWQSFTGQSQEESKGRGWLNALHPEDAQTALDAWSNAREVGAMEADYRVREKKSGSYRYHHTRSVPIRDESGAIVEWLGTSTDIEDLKQAEAARQAIEEQFRLFVDNVREYGLVQTDASGAITNWNPGAERLFGFTPAEMIGKDFALLMTAEDQKDAVFSHELAYVTAGHRNEDARWFVRKDGSQFWARWITEPIHNGMGQFVGLAKIMRDETERERAAAVTKKALAEKEELLKEVHHRVKNNLQVITSLLNLQADQIADKKTLSAFDEARTRVASIASIHELLYRSSSLSAIHLAEYAREFAPNLLNFYGLQRRVRVEVSGDGAKLELERAVPYGLLLNELLSNALKHAFPAERTGSIHISFVEKGSTVLLEVADDGVGLPEGFEVEKTSSLGLKLVRRLARQLRGEVVFSQGQKGTVVQVHFPLST